MGQFVEDMIFFVKNARKLAVFVDTKGRCKITLSLLAMFYCFFISVVVALHKRELNYVPSLILL